MKNKVVQFIINIVVSFITYGFCLWLFDVIFDKDYKIDDGLIFQSALFSIFWTIYMIWSDNKKKSDKQV